jgi:hypothetical protein
VHPVSGAGTLRGIIAAAFSATEHNMNNFRPICGAVLTGIVAAILGGCGGPGETQKKAPFADLSRAEFNQRAAELFLPLFWREDVDGDGNLDANELEILTGGYPRAERSLWIDESGRLTQQFRDAYNLMRKPTPAHPDPAEQKRRQIVLEELAQGRPTLVLTDLTQVSEGEKNFVRHMLTVAELIERLYARQRGVFGLQADIPSDDLASQALFYRNQSPYCEAPKTENIEECSALPKKPPRVVGLYPAEIQKDENFCAMLEKQPNAKALMDHFSVIEVDPNRPDRFRAVPYNQAYGREMDAIARELELAARALGDDEAALKQYLTAAAGSFRSNDWEPANEAWVAMNAQNSKWYVRVGPDEVYYEPCAWKAGFALQLARINPDSLKWQEKLDPLKRDMENRLAEMAGPPYKARNVQFKIPDFIDVVLNAGDMRPAHGATIGQSLPNWGRVAEKGGRTTAMTNLYTDVDSQQSQAELMSSTFCPTTNALATTTPFEGLVSTVLHEAAHNLGPSHEYAVNGRQDDQIFGGPLAATLEELKAQTSAMYLTHWLAERGIFTAEEVRKIQVRNIAWAFGHISRGMYTADGSPRNYSQLAAMQVGSLLKAGALTWHADQTAANGTDQGCFDVNFDALPAAVEAFETKVLQIKARGDRKGAEQLKAEFVDAQDDFAKLKETIAERWLRAPRASFVYSIKM